MKAKDFNYWLKRSTRASKVPLKVQDKTTIDAVSQAVTRLLTK